MIEPKVTEKSHLPHIYIEIILRLDASIAHISREEPLDVQMLQIRVKRFYAATIAEMMGAAK